VVPPGRHHVELVYRDGAVERSLLASGAAVVLWIVIAAIGLVRRRRA
jgi:hypothetical protein